MARRSAFEPIPVQEISLLRDALLAAQAQDEVARERLQRKADEFETLFAQQPARAGVRDGPAVPRRCCTTRR